MITQEDLKGKIHYNRDTGDFSWIDPLNNFARSKDSAGSVHLSPHNGRLQVIIGFNNRSYSAHRLAFLYVTGRMPSSNEQVDHINGDATDNRWCNLRLTDQSGNMKNKKLYKNNKSGVAGVYKKGKRYLAKIRIDKKLISLLSTRDFFEACCARFSAENKYGFHSNHGRR